MPKSLNDLSEAGRQELALALILWRAFKKTSSMTDVKVFQQAYELADILGVRRQFDDLDKKITAPIKITFEQ